MVVFSNRNSEGQLWQQDCPPENASQYNLNRLFYPHDFNDSKRVAINYRSRV